MNINIKTSGFTAKPVLLDFAKEKAGKLLHFYDKIISIDLNFGIENATNKENKTCNIRLVIPGNDLLAAAQSKSFEESLAMATTSLEKQIAKRKSKLAL